MMPLSQNRRWASLRGSCGGDPHYPVTDPLAVVVLPKLTPRRCGWMGLVRRVQTRFDGLADGRQRVGRRRDRGAHMDFSAQLESLQERTSQTVATVRAASAESRAQLKQRIDQAQIDADLALQDAEQDAGHAADRARSKWAQTKADVATKMGNVKAKIDKRSDQIDANVAASDADRAEEEASSAIDFAGWAIDNGRLAVLDALDARAYADERARIARS
jgi:hypothetical protein